MKKPEVGDVVIILAGAPLVESHTQKFIGEIGVVSPLMYEWNDPAQEVVVVDKIDGPLYYLTESLEVIGQL